jgi:peptidoglycan/xylan/chitin deacetylase (PgdA/CDA1 family)
MVRREGRARLRRIATALAVAITAPAALHATPAAAAPGPVVVSLAFDDGLTSQYRLAGTLRQHGVRASFYVNSGNIDARGGGGTMSWAWARELAAAGHEIGGHTRDHVVVAGAGLSLRAKWRQICDDRARLVEQGFHATSFAYPDGELDETAKALVQACGYQSARKAGSIMPTGPHYSDRVPPAEGPYSIRVLGTTHNGPVTLAWLQQAVEAARDNGGGWVPMLFHRVCYQGTDQYDGCMSSYRPVDAAVIRQFLTWAGGEQGISFRPVTEVLNGGVAVPAVKITTPARGSAHAADRPTVKGTASGSGSVTVRIYRGEYSTGSPIATLTANVGAGGAWTVTPSQPLAEGRYTLQASQTRNGVTGTSVPVTFDVDPAAAFATLSRSVVGQGARNAVVVLDGRFLPDAQVRISGRGVKARITSRTARKIRLALNVGLAAPVGARTVTVVNGDGGTATCKGCLRVVRGPRIAAVNPSSAPRGRATTITVRGRAFDASTTVRIGGKGLRVRGVKLIGPRRLRATVRVAGTAPRTARPVTVLNTTTLGQHKVPRALRVT